MKIRYLTFPLLMRRGVCESKDLSEHFKLFSSKHLGEVVYNFLTYGTMYQMNGPSLYMMSS